MEANLHYIVLESLVDEDAETGIYREVETKYATRDALIRDLIDGQYGEPIQIFAFDPATAEVSEEIARAVSELAWKQGKQLPPSVVDFCEDCGIIVPTLERIQRGR